MVNLHTPSNYQDPVPALDVLAISAFPTALEIMAGGTMILMGQHGHRTGALDLSPGDVTLMGRTHDILEEATAATPRLGMIWRGNLHYPDGRMENSLPGRMTVAGEIRRLQPRVVILPHWGSPHPDHKATAWMGEESCTMAALARLDPETPAHRVATVVYASLLTDAAPSFVVDVSAVYERKLEALGTYISEYHSDKAALHDKLDARARYFGELIGARYGEPFVMKSPLRVDDLTKL
jgi:bacillithiol biosynthesis deacetylase BshB1